MKDADIQEFIDSLYYEDQAVMYDHRKYFFNGCSYSLDNQGKEVFSFEIYLINDDESSEMIYWVEGITAQECIEQFLRDKIIDGKTFYELEKDMTVIDW